MAQISRVSLFSKLNPVAYKAIESATAFCKTRGNPYVELAHWLHALFQLPDSDFRRIVAYFDLDSAKLAANLTATLDRLPQGAPSISDLSSHVEEATERAWVYASLLFGKLSVRTGHLIVGLVATPSLRTELLKISTEFRKVDFDTLTDGFEAIVMGSPEDDLGPTKNLLHEDEATVAADSTLVFVNYRRSDTMYASGRIFDRLALRFGKDRIFKDVDSLMLGVRDFEKELEIRLEKTRFFLAVIGGRWLETDNTGARRLDDPEDWVRREIALALRSDA